MPKLYFGNLKCVKEASEWDDYMPEKVEQHCREQIEIASEVDFETFLKMKGMILLEGIFGLDGVCAEDYEFSFTQAKNIIFKTMRDVSFGDFDYLNEEYDAQNVCDNCGATWDKIQYTCENCGSEESTAEENCILEGSAIKKEFFKCIHEIYG